MRTIFFHKLFSRNSLPSFLIGFFSVFATSASFGAANDFLFSQRSGTDSATLTRYVAYPGAGITGLMAYNGATNLPFIYKLGTSFMLSGTTIESASRWENVTGKPPFATVAVSGDYNDLLNKPSPGITTNADWLADSGGSMILNRPVLSGVAISGSYMDLADAPMLSSVATSGAYSDLSGLPTIPPAQVQSDWNASSSPAAILNKPALFSGAYSALTGIPSTFAPAAHTQAWSTITATPTTLSGYGITDGLNASALAPYATTASVNAGLSGKFATPTGNTTQYLRGDGSVATFPALSSGTVTSVTAGSGLSGGTITGAGTISMPNTGTAGTYSSVTTDAQGRVSSGTARTQASASRTLNTAFQVSTTRDALVNYSVQCTITASIAGGQSCDVILEIATDAAFTTGVQTVGIIGTGQTYTLAIAIQGVQPQTAQVTGYVPAGYYARLRTVNVSGSPVYAYRAGQEILQ